MVTPTELNPEERGQYRMYRITVRCKSCGEKLSADELGDNSQWGAEQNAIQGKVFEHGHGLNPPVSTCPSGGGKEQNDYEIVSVEVL